MEKKIKWLLRPWESPWRCLFAGKTTIARRRGAHCDAALGLMVSVDYVGKLFERLEANAPARHDKRYRNTTTGIPPHSASFCPRHGYHQTQGAFRSAGRVSFVTFLCPPKKSKIGKPVKLSMVSKEF